MLDKRHQKDEEWDMQELLIGGKKTPRKQDDENYAGMWHYSLYNLPAHIGTTMRNESRKLINNKYGTVSSEKFEVLQEHRGEH